MYEINLLTYINSGVFVEQVIEDGLYPTIYADVAHLYPQSQDLTEFKNVGTGPIMIILSRLTVAQLFEMYDLSDCSQVTVINLHVGVAGIGHKLSIENNDIEYMTSMGRSVNEPVSLSDFQSILSDVTNCNYVRITHRYVPDAIDMQVRDGLRYFGNELAQSMTLFPGSMIETVGKLDPEEQSSQYIMICDRATWFLSDSFAEVASFGGTSIVVMEQSAVAAQDYCDMIRGLYPKHRIYPITIGQLRPVTGDIILDEYRDERYGCDVTAVHTRLRSN